MNRKLRNIINYYGLNKQLKYLQSEVFEFNEAIYNYKKDSINDLVNDVYREVKNAFSEIFSVPLEKDLRREHIIEEFADVLVLLKQLQLYYNIPTKDIREIMQLKIKRQLQRIEEEKKQKQRGEHFEKI